MHAPQQKGSSWAVHCEKRVVCCPSASYCWIRLTT